MIKRSDYNKRVMGKLRYEDWLKVGEEIPLLWSDILATVTTSEQLKWLPFASIYHNSNNEVDFAIYNHIAERWLNANVCSDYTIVDDELILPNRSKIIYGLLYTFGDKWAYIYKALSEEYNIFDNVNYSETTNGDITDVNVKSGSIDKTNDDVYGIRNSVNTGLTTTKNHPLEEQKITTYGKAGTVSDDYKETQTYSNRTETKVSAFDSSNYEPKEEITRTTPANSTGDVNKRQGSITETTKYITDSTHTDSETISGGKYNDEVTTYNSLKDDAIKTWNDLKKVVKGYNGKYPRSEIITSEVETRAKNILFDVILNDIKDYITLKIY